MGGLISSEPERYYGSSPSRISSTMITKPNTYTRTTNANQYSSDKILNSPGCYSNSRSIGIRSSDCLYSDYNSSTYSPRQIKSARPSSSSISSTLLTNTSTRTTNANQYSSGEILNSPGCYSNSRSLGIPSSDCFYSDYNTSTYSSRQKISAAPHIYLSKIVPSKLNWADQDSEVLKIELQATDAEYVMIRHMFNETTRKSNHVITKIERVQNPYLMGRYEMKKSELKNRVGFVEERLLFHGTKVQNVANICKDNLNWRMHGKGTGHRYGQGVSFSPISHYSSFYCDKKVHDKVMIVTKVMIANRVIGDGNMLIPPYLDFYRKIRYDTSIKEDESVIVKYCDDEFYPAYVIHFYAKYLNIRKKK